MQRRLSSGRASQSSPHSRELGGGQGSRANLSREEEDGSLQFFRAFGHVELYALGEQGQALELWQGERGQGFGQGTPVSRRENGFRASLDSAEVDVADAEPCCQFSQWEACSSSVLSNGCAKNAHESFRMAASLTCFQQARAAAWPFSVSSHSSPDWSARPAVVKRFTDAFCPEWIFG